MLLQYSILESIVFSCAEYSRGVGSLHESGRNGYLLSDAYSSVNDERSLRAAGAEQVSFAFVLLY